MKESKEKYGTLYLGMLTQTLLQRLYSSVFLLRRMAYAVLTVVCESQPFILIHSFIATNILYWIYLGYSSPNDTKLARRMEYFNEFGLQVITYHLGVFLATKVEAEFIYGWSMIGMVGLVFVGNITVVIIVSLAGIFRKIKLCSLKKR